MIMAPSGGDDGMLWVWVGIGIGAVFCLLILLLVLFLVRKRRASATNSKPKESAEIGSAMSYFSGDTVKEGNDVTSNYMSVAEATGKIQYLDGNSGVPSPASSESLYGEVPKKAAPTRYSGMPEVPGNTYSEIDIADRDTVYVETLPLSKE
jgi:hypothetical protein